MLDAYKTLQAHGVIGNMMKVDANGKEVIDPQGKLPGNMVPRPFQEYPKVVRRQRADGTVLEKLVGSKSEELRLIAEAPDLEEVQSPLERERDQLARTVAEQDKALASQTDTISKLTDQMTALMASVEKLTQLQSKSEPTALELGAEIRRAGLTGDKQANDAESRATKGFGQAGK